MKKTESKASLNIKGIEYTYFNISQIKEAQNLPFSLKILLENVLRKQDGTIITEEHATEIASGKDRTKHPFEIPHHPGRVLMQDFTGVPAVVDLAAMRDAVKKAGGDPLKINPLVPVDLVIDHSVQLDHYGTPEALAQNVEKEYERNKERYSLLKWAQKSFDNFRVVPPNSGIIHQINLEYLGEVVQQKEEAGEIILYPDSLVGTDSHSTMINGLGVMGWGVGGIEAEAVICGQPYYMLIPDVVGVKLTGKLKPGITATDMVLTIVQMLRKHGVVGKFVEFIGEGMKNLGVTDRAVIANMSPEYGATMGFFPVDENTIDYLKLTGRNEKASIVEAYAKAQGMFYTGTNDPHYSTLLELDLSTVVPSLAGPSRPQDRLNFSDTQTALGKVQTDKSKERGAIEVRLGKETVQIDDGTIAIASITSCTNTSSPALMIGAGLVAKKAAAKGLKVPSWVKTTLAPGSRVVKDYLEKAGLLSSLENLGFNIAAFGCATCIGNSGPLHPAIEEAASTNDIALTSVLSGNRNFEARIHQLVKGNFLASPPLVVAYALAGRITIDLSKEPICKTAEGEDVFLVDIWPTDEEIQSLIDSSVSGESFRQQYESIFEGDEYWQSLQVEESETFQWDPDSTYIRNPPFFEGFTKEITLVDSIEKARPLLLLGDSITTDHISPAGAIPKDYPAGQYLLSHKVDKVDFNSYGSRRGNHEVMMRGTFGNIRVKNQLVAPKEGSYTKKFPEDDVVYIYDGAMSYKEEGTPLLVMSGKEYGTGSSRDWAAKGTILLGARFVIAQSYERIHRSNLVGMGVLPLEFIEGQSWESLGIKGDEQFSIHNLKTTQPGDILTIEVQPKSGDAWSFKAKSRLDTIVDLGYFQNGGILPYVIRQLI
ncbi:aconitate hydratase AcnA [Spirochaeta cellobiosiphila]|uniref:aconitate hydratase AcnA n=1 Tax=Spirochaeta cellobiosiphila TaxID=504483 RepID=UPI0003F668D2|nr:aconitate hydratase AcnA [Spirochaeta cellobiosiphila]